jgi:tetratricopeptide (TPR) repeat protein
MMMKTKSTCLITALLGLTVSSAVLANSESNALKIAVVADNHSSKNIVNGLYHSSMNKLTRYSRSQKTYNNHMNLCVAYLKVGKAKKSTQACSAAVTSAEIALRNDSNSNYLKALSYSNRAVAKYQSKDIVGAIADLDKAVLIDANDITESNLRVMKQHLKSDAEIASGKISVTHNH